MVTVHAPALLFNLDCERALPRTRSEMGFFAQFKRNANGNDDENDSCARAVSLFPSKHAETQILQDSGRASKTVGAKSFSYGSLGKIKAAAANEDARRKSEEEREKGFEAQHVEYTAVSQFTGMISVYKGAISTVYRAKCVETGRKLIVKIYFHDKMNSKQLHKLKRELELQKLVKDCPYVCNLLDNFDEGNQTHIILEDCEGGDLFKKMMKQGGSIAETRTCTEVIVPLLRVLETLDKLNIIHRDIKPENIFLTGSGQIRLGDFGLAIDCSKEIPFYRSGTLDYMAPEVLINPSTRLEEGEATLAQLEARKIVPYTTKTDVWATGVLAYELVTGHPPFEVDNESETVRLILTCDHIEMPTCHSAEWASFVRTALTKKHRKRPSASALLEHPWIVKNMARAVSNGRTADLERLLEPIPMHTFGSKASPEQPCQEPADEVSDSLPSAGAHLAEDSEGLGSTSALNSIRMVDGKGSVVFSVPSDADTDVPVQQFSTEERNATMQARGMKARLQLYINRQRIEENGTGALPVRANSL